MDDVTRTLTRQLVEQGEPTDTGEWHTMRLRDLINQGYEFIEFHYPDVEDDPTPNAARLMRSGD